MSEHKVSDELELSDEHLERNDTIDNAVFDCIKILAEKEVEWDMSLIGEATDSLKEVMLEHGIVVRHPGIVTEDDGSQHIEEYETDQKIVIE